MSIFNASMIDHLNIGVSDANRSRDFYVKALEPLGYRSTLSIPPEHAEVGGEQAKANGTLHGFGLEHKPLFWILGNSRAGTGTHIGFKAANRAQVDAFYNAALAAGGTDNGKPDCAAITPITMARLFSTPMGSISKRFATLPNKN